MNTDADKNAVKICEKVSFEFFTINHGEALNGWVHPDRILNYNVFLFIESGVFRVTEDNIDYELYPNEVFFLKSGLRHFGKAPVADGTKWDWIHFYDNICPFCRDNLPCPLFTHTRARSPEAHMLVLPKRLLLPNPSVISKKIKTAAALSASYLQTDRIALNSLIFDIFIETMRQARYRNRTCYDIIAARVMDFISNNLFCSSEELSKSLNFNYEYLSRAFSKSTGITIAQYRNYAKIQHAIALFRTTTMGVAEVAEALHFENQFYFSRIFKQVVGIPPRTYKQSIYTTAISEGPTGSCGNKKDGSSL